MTHDARITPEEIATRLQICRGTVYAMLGSGQIPAMRPNHRWVILRAVYERWEAARWSSAHGRDDDN